MISLPALIGTEKQAAWATAIRDELLTKLSQTGVEVAEILSVTQAEWWISVRSMPIDEASIKQMAGAAWLTNHQIGKLPTASSAKVNQALRNGGKLEPLKYGFGTMCGAYTHLLTLKNGSQFVVNSKHVPAEQFEQGAHNAAIRL